MSERYGFELCITLFLIGCVIGNMNNMPLLGAVSYSWAFVLFIITLLSMVGCVIIFRFRSYSLYFIFVSFLILGLIRTHISNLSFPDFVLDAKGNFGIYTGKVISNPEIKDSKKTFVFLVKDFVLNNSDKKDIKFRVSLSKEESIYYGDILKIQGTIKKPENFKTNNNREFNYISYLKAKDITLILDRPKIISREQDFNLIKQIYSIRESFINSLKKVLSEPEASLASGILLGDKGGLGQDLEDKFRKTGLSHIIVLSGFNITIISVLITKLFFRFRKTWRLILAIMALIIFCTMVGWTATVFRSFIMSAIMCYSDFVKREYDMWRALFLSSFIMSIINPLLISYDPSFQLSFLATISLASFSGIFNKVFKFLPETLLIRETVSNTLSAQILTTPYILNMTGMLSLLSPASNLLILPTIPYAMLASFISGLLGYVSVSLGKILSLITYGILHYIIIVVEYLGSFNFYVFNIF